MMTISIIIPVYNAEKFLPFLFTALNKCHFVEGDEILLVDNGSSDSSYEICMAQEKEKPSLYKTLLFCDKSGSYAARNFTVKRAKGEVLVFTDSDTKPTEQWLDAIRENIHPGIVIAGKIELEIVNNGLWEYFDTIAHLNSEMNAKNNCIATANMAVYKKDFDSVGLFEERFSGGDYEWSTRAARAGLSVKFLPEAKVFHPTRKSFEQILVKERRIAYGSGNHHKIMNKPLITLMVKYILKIVKFDTNIRYSKRLKKYGVSFKEICYFNIKFMRIRIEQLKYAVRGFQGEDARKFNLK